MSNETQTLERPLSRKWEKEGYVLHRDDGNVLGQKRTCVHSLCTSVRHLSIAHYMRRQAAFYVVRKGPLCHITYITHTAGQLLLLVLLILVSQKNFK